MLELKNISIDLSINDRRLIENLNFTLNQGDRAVIIGEEGNGKSTLLKLIYDEHLVDGYCRHSGQIIKKGSMAYLPQMFPEDQLGISVGTYFKGCDTHYFGDVWARLNLLPSMAVSPQIIETLSGGEKVKIQLAKILMSQPDILLLDEPTNDLDIDTLNWLEGFINGCGLPVLYISHDETLIERTANVIIHIEQLKRKTQCRVTIAGCGYGEYTAHRVHNFGKQMQVAKKQRSDYDAQMERWRQIYNRVDHDQRSISRADPGGGRLLKKKMKSVKSMEKRLERQAEDFVDIPLTEDAILTRFSGDIAIPASKVILDMILPELRAGERLLSEGVALKVMGGSHIGIIGKNGAGKSTLLRAIWEALKDRRDIAPCYMPQDYAEVLDYALTPVEFLAARYAKDDITKARTFMGSMRFTHEEMNGRIGRLSGGQRAKILFLDMVIRNANVLVLDEPTRNFSPLSGPVIRQTLADFGGAIISVSHDRKYLDEVCGAVYELTGTGLVRRYDMGGGV